MVSVKEFLDKIENGENVSDEELKDVAKQTIDLVEQLGSFDLEQIKTKLNLDEGRTLRLYALICAKDEYASTKACTEFNNYVYNKPSRGKKKAKKEEESESKPETITQRISPEYTDREFLTGGLNFDNLGRAYTLTRNMVFHPAVQLLYDLLKRTYITLIKDNGEKVSMPLINYTIGAEPDREVGFMSWVNSVILRYYSSLGIEPVVLLTGFKEQMPMILEQQNMKMESLPDYFTVHNVYVKLRGNRVGHVKVAMESELSEGE